MTKRKWVVTTSSVFLVLLLITGYMAVAAEYNSSSDPLVSASYITDVLAPGTIQEVNEKIDQKVQQFTTQLNQTLASYSEEIEKIVTEIDTKNNNLATDQAFIDAVVTQVMARMSGESTGGATSDGGETTSLSGINGWKLVEIEKGQIFLFEVGGMILPRIGGAVCYAPSNPGLINVSTGSELSADGALAINNLYVVTVASRGFKATSNVNKFLVYGSYTIQ